MRGSTPSTVLHKNSIFAWADTAAQANLLLRAEELEISRRGKRRHAPRAGQDENPKAEKSKNDLGGENSRRHPTSVFACATFCMSREHRIGFHAEVDHKRADQLMSNVVETV